MAMYLVDLTGFFIRQKSFSRQSNPAHNQVHRVFSEHVYCAANFAFHCSTSTVWVEVVVSAPTWHTAAKQTSFKSQQNTAGSKEDFSVQKYLIPVNSSNLLAGLHFHLQRNLFYTVKNPLAYDTRIYYCLLILCWREELNPLRGCHCIITWYRLYIVFPHSIQDAHLSDKWKLSLMLPELNTIASVRKEFIRLT